MYLCALHAACKSRAIGRLFYIFKSFGLELKPEKYEKSQKMFIYDEKQRAIDCKTLLSVLQCNKYRYKVCTNEIRKIKTF